MRDDGELVEMNERGYDTKYGIFYTVLDLLGSAHNLLQAWTDGNLYIQLGDPQAHTPLGDPSKLSELLLRLDEIPGISLSTQAEKKWAYFHLTALSSETARERPGSTPPRHDPGEYPI
jgi:hypothetical protein